VLLAETSGASGERVYVAVVGVSAGRAHSLATALVGDRTRIRSLTLVERAIVMDVIEAGPEDAMCCPTQLARKSFTLEQGALEMVSSEPTGTVSIAALADTAWTLVRMDDEPWPEDVPPATLALDGTRVAGFAGCNRFSGAVEETSPGRITMGPLVSTRMACPAPRMDLEHHFLDALGKATQYGFLMGRLALTAVDGTTIRRLEFAPGR
jgi:heat shock protein HslJ